MRREFPTSVRTAVVKRATRDGVVYCEKCKGLAKQHQIDHIIPDSLYGEPVLANAMLICRACWEVKNPQDTKDAAKAKRREAIHLGSKKPTAHPIPSRPKPKRESRPVASGQSEIARRYGR